MRFSQHEVKALQLLVLGTLLLIALGIAFGMRSY